GVAAVANDEVTVAANRQVFGAAGDAVATGRQVGDGVDFLHPAANVVDAGRAGYVPTLDDGFGEAGLDLGHVALEGGGFDVGQIIGDDLHAQVLRRGSLCRDVQPVWHRCLRSHWPAPLRAEWSSRLGSKVRAGVAAG